MAYDFNDADSQRTGELIPDGTAVPVHMTLRPGGAGDEGWLKMTKRGDGMMLDAEFTVVEGEYARRKFWSLFTVDGTTDGQKTAVSITRSRIRAMLESARGIDPTDESDKAVSGRRIESFADLDGLRFWAVVGLEKGTDGYKDKNVLKAVITPDRREWSKLAQDSRQAAKSAPAAAKAATAAPKSNGASRPSWA
jgi:hypothetical protein